MSKDSFYALLDSLNENQIEDYKNIYMYTADGETSYIKIKIVYDTDYMLGFVQDVTQIMEAVHTRITLMNMICSQVCIPVTTS